jgi:hypothetical protein
LSTRHGKNRVNTKDISFLLLISLKDSQLFKVKLMIICGIYDIHRIKMHDRTSGIERNCEILPCSSWECKIGPAFSVTQHYLWTKMENYIISIDAQKASDKLTTHVSYNLSEN